MKYYYKTAEPKNTEQPQLIYPFEMVVAETLDRIPKEDLIFLVNNRIHNYGYNEFRIYESLNGPKYCYRNCSDQEQDKIQFNSLYELDHKWPGTSIYLARLVIDYYESHFWQNGSINDDLNYQIQNEDEALDTFRRVANFVIHKVLIGGSDGKIVRVPVSRD